MQGKAILFDDYTSQQRTCSADEVKKIPEHLRCLPISDADLEQLQGSLQYHEFKAPGEDGMEEFVGCIGNRALAYFATRASLWVLMRLRAFCRWAAAC